MTAPHRPGQNSATRPSTDESMSTGQLVGEIAGDLQKLLKQELELAKAEVQQEAGKAATAAGMLGGAGLAGYLFVLLASLAAVFGLGNLMDLGWAALIVAAGWGIVGAALFALGHARLRRVSPKPERTIQTMKEDARWARHPAK
jgi:putative superfamily III holin-X